MKDKNKKRDPMPPPDATPEEVGEFWDTHSLADYWDETHEVEFQVNLKSRQNLSLDEAATVDQENVLSTEQGWRKLRDLIQSIKPKEFEELAAVLLTSFLEDSFVVARAGDQPSGDARSLKGEVSIQAKKYTGKNSPNAKTIEGDIRQAIRTLPNLQVYVLALSRDTAQLRDTLDAISVDTGVDIVTLELTDELSDLGALCVTYWEDICQFFDLSNTNQEFLAWVQIVNEDSKTRDKMKAVRTKLKEGIQTQKHVQKDAEKYLHKRFSTNKGFNPINLSQAIGREFIESKISDWWEAGESPICRLEGEEGHGKSWLAAKAMNSIYENENIVVFWLDSKDWKDAKSIFDLLYACFHSIYLSYDERKIAKLQNKPAKIWRKTLIVLDGVNEQNAIRAAQRILSEYFRNEESEWSDRIRFLLTTRPLDDYPDFKNNLWDSVHKISVDPFNDSELQDALARKDLQLDDLPDSLKKDIARIPRYFQRCVELRNELGSFDVVTKAMVLWADLLYKIKYAEDPQIRKKLDWQRIEEAQDDLAKLAKEAKWTNINDAPQASVELLKECFPNYHEIRRDLEEQHIALKAYKRQAELSEDHVVLGWALYLSNLFDSAKFSDIENLFECFQQELEPIPSEDLRTEALFVALQVSAISPPNIPQDQLSQKRAALMLVWFNSHNARITNKHISFWVQTDVDAYAQVVRVQLESPNHPNYEEALIGPLAKVWLHQTGQIDQLRSRLTKWLPATSIDDSPEDIVYVRHEGKQLPRKKGDIQTQLASTAISILSQRPEHQFLKTLARCYGILQCNANFDDDSSRRMQFYRFYENLAMLMRWGYTEVVLDDLCSLAEETQSDPLLLKGIYALAGCLRVDLPPLLERPLSEEDRELYARAKRFRSNFKSAFERVSNQEQFLIGESPKANVKGNYHGLDYLAVRTDLPDLRDDLEEIKRVLHYIAMNAKLGQSAWMTLEDSCIDNLLPWVAKHDPESYAELACSLKLNALNQKLAQIEFSSIQGLIFKPEDREKIVEAILGIKERLTQDKDFYSDIGWFASLLTETLLFSASEEQLINWFEFLASHESLRKSIFTETQEILLRELLPESIVRLAQQKLENSQLALLSNQFSSDIESEKITEEDFWSWLYLCTSDNDENTVTWAFENLKRMESGLRTMTFCFLHKATSDSNRFLSEIFTDKEVRKHLFLTEGRFFSTPIYEGENSYTYEDLVSVLPQEVVGSFLCSPQRRADLFRWGKELMEKMCSILQGDETNRNSAEELRFTINREVLQTWAIHNTTDFTQLATEYFDLLSKSGWYCRGLYDFMDNILCLLLRFQPITAMQYYRQSTAGGGRIIFRAYGGVESFFAQLWRVDDCNLPEHHVLRRESLEECLNDEEIMFRTLAALVEGGKAELWNLVTEEYLASPYAKERNLGVSILPWFGTNEAIEELERLKSDDTSLWVRKHAWWAYEVVQQERSCREVYREALQTRDLFRISAVFEQIKPALSPTARWWHEIEHKKFREESQNIDSSLAALVDRFWYQWGNSQKTKSNIEIFGRKLKDYCRGEKLSMGSTPRLAPWWKPSDV